MSRGRDASHQIMDTMIDLNGVRTRYAEHGAGDPLVYLHGGMSDARELDPVPTFVPVRRTR